MIAKQMGWTSPATQFKVSIVGLFHDVGKKEIDCAILDKPRASMTAEDLKVLESHPIRGMEILSQIASVPGDGVQITLQHHERDQGTGYPHHLTKMRIHPLARLIAVADEFCKLAIKGPDSSGLSPFHALERLISVQGTSVDSAFIDCLKKVIEQRAP